MAPTTGAVLSKILNDFIVEYPIRHPRFQPFTIVEKETGKTIVKSSNSDDFMWEVFKALADMFVDIEPVLVPNRYRVRIYVQHVDRDFENIGSEKYVNMIGNDNDDYTGQNAVAKMNVANAAAQFYDKMFSCVKAIGSGDYSAFDKTPEPSLQPTSKPTTVPTANPTVYATHSPSGLPTSVVTVLTSQPTLNSTRDTNQTSADSNYQIPNHENKTVVDDYDNNKHSNESHGQQNFYAKNDDTDNEGRNLRSVINNEADDIHDDDDDYYVDDNQNDDNNNAESQSQDMEKIVQDAEDAAQEALEAAELAEESAKTVNENEAVIAAAQAAEAAKKAAQATSEAAALNAMEYIFSGDGEMMTTAISTCFQDPKYGIRNDKISVDSEGNEQITTTTNAFVYIDGSHYFRLNLTSPFVTVSRINEPLPKANILPEGKGDFVDILLAAIIISFFSFGMYVMLQKIGLVNRDRNMKFEWFFHPTKYRGSHKRLDNFTDDIESASMDDDDGRHEISNGRGSNESHQSIELTNSISNNENIVSRRSSYDGYDLKLSED